MGEPQPKKLKLKIPPGKDTWAKQMAFAISVLEAVRLEHNEMGRQFREGEITEAVWEAYKLDVWHQRQNAVSKSVGDLKHSPAPGDLAEVDLENGFEDDDDQ